MKMLSTEVIPEHLTSAMRETASATRESISAFRAASPTKGFLCTTNTATNGTTCAAADRYCTISQITCSRKDVEYSLISESLDDHSVSAWNDYTLAYKYFLTQHIKLPKDRIFRKIGDSSPQIEYQEFLRQRLKGFESLTVYHALIQELMAKTQFPGNDNERRLLRGIRCTTTTALRRAQYDKPVWFERAVYESGSLFVARLFGNTKRCRQRRTAACSAFIFWSGLLVIMRHVFIMISKTKRSSLRPDCLRIKPKPSRNQHKILKVWD
ncbi:MAG: hypothetical protein J7M29_00410 [Verrucomicrobia bacterium]|nr:hypothetical protein [Verrucomicrobiota bacterium]